MRWAHQFAVAIGAAALSSGPGRQRPGQTRLAGPGDSARLALLRSPEIQKTLELKAEQTQKIARIRELTNYAKTKVESVRGKREGKGEDQDDRPGREGAGAHGARGHERGSRCGGASDRSADQRDTRRAARAHQQLRETLKAAAAGFDADSPAQGEALKEQQKSGLPRLRDRHPRPDEEADRHRLDSQAERGCRQAIRQAIRRHQDRHAASPALTSKVRIGLGGIPPPRRGVCAQLAELGPVEPRETWNSLWHRLCIYPWLAGGSRRQIHTDSVLRGPRKGNYHVQAGRRGLVGPGQPGAGRLFAGTTTVSLWPAPPQGQGESRGEEEGGA